MVKRKRVLANSNLQLDLKPSRRRRGAKHRPETEINLEQPSTIDTATKDDQFHSNHTVQGLMECHSDMSVDEQGNLHMPENAIKDTKDWRKPRHLEHLPDFLEQFSSVQGESSNLCSAAVKKGAPHTLVISSSGFRAVDVVRTLRKFQTTDAIVAKLFAKHIKLKEAVEYVKKTRMGIGVGTPGRIIDLLNAGALSSENLERVVVDYTYVDTKNRSIVTMSELRMPLFKLLNRDEIKTRYSSSANGVIILLF